MKPVAMTLGKGNCLAACVASLLEIPLEEVPPLEAHEKGIWIERLGEWLPSYNLNVLVVHEPHRNIGIGFETLVIGVGSVAREPEGFDHACIFRPSEIRDNDVCFELVHDPYPGSLGLMSDRLDYLITFVPVNAALWSKPPNPPKRHERCVSDGPPFSPCSKCGRDLGDEDFTFDGVGRVICRRDCSALWKAVGAALGIEVDHA